MQRTDRPPVEPPGLGHRAVPLFWEESMKHQPRDCGDCAVAPGRPHQSGCDIERCSICGGQWIACGHEGHDPLFARWTGFYPGELEAEALGLDLNALYNPFQSPSLVELFFVKPPPTGHAARREPGGVRMEENFIQCCEEGVKIGSHNPWACMPSEPCSKCRHIMEKHWRDD